MSYDGDAWAATEGEGENPDVTLAVSPEAWTMFLTVTKEERIKLAQMLNIFGTSDRVSEFMKTFGVSGRKEPG